jgi:hypothetical protein
MSMLDLSCKELNILCSFSCRLGVDPLINFFNVLRVLSSPRARQGVYALALFPHFLVGQSGHILAIGLETGLDM